MEAVEAEHTAQSVLFHIRGLAGLNIEELLLTQTVADADHLKIGLQADRAGLFGERMVLAIVYRADPAREDVGTHCVVDTLLEAPDACKNM